MMNLRKTADEIRRLRELVANQKDTIEKAMKVIEQLEDDNIKLQDENQKLQAALADEDIIFPNTDIDNAPTVEALKDITELHCDITKEQLLNALIPQGEWIKIGDIGLAYTCNKCGEVNVIPTNFCPNCGAKMKDGAE